MDKDVLKRLLRDAGVPIARFLVVNRYSPKEIGFDNARNQLGLPLFIKPANLGSSVGIHKVKDREEFERAVCDALDYDNKILIEERIRGREIECSVLGNENPIASVPGEILPRHEFYSGPKRNISMRTALRWKYRQSCRPRLRSGSANWQSKRFLCSAAREWHESISF